MRCAFARPGARKPPGGAGAGLAGDPGRTGVAAFPGDAEVARKTGSYKGGRQKPAS